MTTKTFTPEETAVILKQLDSGEALAHELAATYGCRPSDIRALWDERNRAR